MQTPNTVSFTVPGFILLVSLCFFLFIHVSATSNFADQVHWQKKKNNKNGENELQHVRIGPWSMSREPRERFMSLS